LRSYASPTISLYARLFFSASAMLFGVLALMWHDADTWQNVANVWRLPGGIVIGECLMVAQMAGAAGILFSRTERGASFVLGLVYVIFALACIPDIIAAPSAYVGYGSFFNLLAPAFGAVAVHAAATTEREHSVALSRVARLGLGVCAVSFTLAQIFYPGITAQLVPKWIPPSQMFWVILTTIAFGLAALAILINRQARLAIRLMALMLTLFGAVVWVPLLIVHPATHFNWSEFALTLIIAGGAWVVGELTPS
jgi:hypothetical protein